ncbi:MAG: hypothetical protein ACI4UM_05870 [Succinivibrio sp.]
MVEKNNAVRPQKVNAGGIFAAIVKGAIQPLSGLILVPLMFLVPSLAASVYYHVFKRQDQRVLNFKRGFSFDLGYILVSELIYIAFVYLFYRIFEVKYHEYLEIYKEKALNNKVLQIATPEQLEYSHSMNTLICILSVCLIVVLLFIIAYTFIHESETENIDRVLGFKGRITAILKALWINLPVYLIFTVLLIYIFAVIETYFSRYKLLYIEAVILRTDGFDPTYPFLLARYLVISTAVYSLNLFTFCALGFTPKLSIKKTV